MSTAAAPRVFLSAAARRLRQPWAYSTDLRAHPGLASLPAGALVRLADPVNAKDIATAFYNPHSKIGARLAWTAHEDPDGKLDLGTWMRRRLRAASALRERLLQPADARWCRIIHAESDGMPGLAIDRYDRCLTVQINSAAFDLHKDELLAAIDDTLAPAGVVVRRDAPVRVAEGLTVHDEPELRGDVPATLDLLEDGLVFPVNLRDGQKTGWYYDHRQHRKRVARLCAGRRVLDLFCHTGAFGIQAAAHGAAHVLCVDRSQASIDLGAEAARRNGVADRVTFVKSDVSKLLRTWPRDSSAEQKYDVIIIDPPPFVPVNVHLTDGLRTYERLVTLSLRHLAPSGLLFVASCSHRVTSALLLQQVRQSLRTARREGRVLHRGSADVDHPVNVNLLQTDYMSTLLLHVD